MEGASQRTGEVPEASAGRLGEPELTQDFRDTQHLHPRKVQSDKHQG